MIPKPFNIINTGKKMKSIAILSLLLLVSASYAFQSDSVTVNSIVASGSTSAIIPTWSIAPNIQNNFDQKVMAVLDMSGSVTMENDKQVTTMSSDGSARVVKSKIDGWCFYENLTPRTSGTSALTSDQLQDQAIALAVSLKDANKWTLVRYQIRSRAAIPAKWNHDHRFDTYNFAPVINGIVVAAHDYTMSISLRPDGAIESIENNAATVTLSAKALPVAAADVQTKLNNRINSLNILNDQNQKCSVVGMQLIKSVTCYIKKQNGDHFYLVHKQKLITASLQMDIDATPMVMTFPLD